MQSFPDRCHAWIMSQFGPLLQLPQEVMAPIVPLRFPEVARAIGEGIEKAPLSLPDIDAIAKRFETEPDRVMTIVTSLTAGQQPLVQMVFRDKGGNLVPPATAWDFARAKNTRMLKKTFVSWEKVAE